MIIILYILGSLALLIIISKVIAYINFKNEIFNLFRQSSNPTVQKFNYAQTDNLPEPVQRYFKHVLKDGQPYINYIRIKHDGIFKAGLDKDWMNIRGEQYFTTEKPGFIWNGSTTLFTARDMYIADKGRLVVSLLSLINIVDAKGEQYDQGELLRWLGESIWFPTNLLPCDRIKWVPIDSLTAKLIFTYNKYSLFFFVTFNEQREIVQLETKRYMDENNLETWICKASNYKELNQILIPTICEVFWKIDGVEKSYAKFNITNINYEQPQKY